MGKDNNIPYEDIKAKLLSKPEVRAEYERLQAAHPRVAFPYSEWTRVEDGLPETDDGEYWLLMHGGHIFPEMTWYGADDPFWMSHDGGMESPRSVLAYASYHTPEVPKWA